MQCHSEGVPQWRCITVNLGVSVPCVSQWRCHSEGVTVKVCHSKFRCVTVPCVSQWRSATVKVSQWRCVTVPCVSRYRCVTVQVCHSTMCVTVKVCHNSKRVSQLRCVTRCVTVPRVSQYHVWHGSRCATVVGVTTYLISGIIQRSVIRIWAKQPSTSSNTRRCCLVNNGLHDLSCRWGGWYIGRTWRWIKATKRRDFRIYVRTAISLNRGGKNKNSW